MTHNPQAIRAGVFVLAAVAVGFTLLLMLGSAARWLDPRPTRRVHFPVEVGVAGLSVGDPVRLGGVKIGNVSGVRVEVTKPAREPEVVVEFELPREFDLREDADVRVGGTLTGLAWLEIVALGDGPPLARGGRLVGRAGAFQSLLAQMSDLAPRIGETFTRVHDETLPRVHSTLDSGTSLVHRIEGHIDPVAERVHQLAQAGTGAMAEARDVLGGSKQDIQGGIANLRHATQTLDERLGPTLDRFDAMLSEAHTLAKSLNESTENLRAMLENGRELSQSARSLLASSRDKIERMVDALQAAAVDAKLGLAEIRRSPWRLLHKPKQREDALLDLYASARQFSEGAREVSQAAAALRDAASDPQVDEESLNRLLVTLEDHTAALGEAQRRFWERARE